MNIRPKTIRRLIILFLAFAILLGTGAGLYVHNTRQREARFARDRARGLAAFATGNYEATIAALDKYPRREMGDTEAMFAFATARSRVELSGDEHNKQAIAEFRQLLTIKPDDLPSKHALLLIYNYRQYSTETITLADEVLAKYPDDLTALSCKKYSLDRQRKFDAALAVSMRINEVDPNNIEEQLSTFDLMRRIKRPPIEILARAKQLQSAHENDPRFELLLARAYGYSGDDEQGKFWLRKAASRPAPDAAFVRHIASLFDALKLFDESQALLDRAVIQNPDPQIMRVLVQRLWQSGRADLAAQRLEKLDPADPKADADLLAFRALALCELDRVKEAEPILAALAQRKNDPRAAAWEAALSARFGPNQVDPKTAIARYRTALTRDPENAVILFMMGEAYARLGETELAINEWKRASDLAPSWARPHVLIARTFAGTSRLLDAKDEAEQGVRCAPGDLAAAATLVNIRFKLLEQRSNPADVNDLLQQVTRIQKLAPADAETLPIYISLLARTGQRDAAIATIKSALARRKPYDQPTLMRLVSASRANDLGQENAILEAAGKEQELSPRLALAQAADMATHGKPMDGLALMEKRVAAAPTTQQTTWNLALAEYREAIHDPAAAQQWIALGDSHPDDLAVQNAILASGASARANREFVAKTIDRLKKLTGDEGTTWKLEHARWLITSDATEKDCAAAVNILTDLIRESPKLIEARKLLAAAMQQLNNLSGATKAMQAAADLAPQDAGINLELAGLLQQQARFQEARAYLEVAAKSQDLSTEARRRVAAMFAQQGENARAAELLELAKSDLDDSSLILLADVYRRLGRNNDAQAIFASATSRKILSPELIQATAEFYASQKRMDQASALLGRLPEVQMRPGTRELILAKFEERFGDKEAALKQYVAATHAAAADADAWRQLAGFHLRSRRFDEAVEALDGGLKSLPSNADLKSLRTIAIDLAAAKFDAVHPRPLTDALIANPTLTAATQMLACLTDAKKNNLKPDDILKRLTKLTGQFPRFMPAHIAIVQINLAQNKTQDAMTAAETALAGSAGEADPARLTTEVARIAHKWDRMASAAQKWRERTMDDPMAADLALAEARLQLRDAKSALVLVTPYISQCSSEPDRNPAAVATVARVLAAGGNEGDARSLLEPLLTKSKQWRILWLSVAGDEVATREAAGAWIQQAAPLVSGNDKDEQFALAGAWQAVAMRFTYPQASQTAAQILKPLCERTDASPEAIAMMASISQSNNDFAAAEAGYRRALQLNSELPGALNNLAYILLSQGRDLAEARKLAEKAVTLSPRDAPFHDTLARIAARTGDTEQALASFQNALSIDPENLESLIGMASTLAGAGKKESAGILLLQIDRLMKNRPALSESLQRELELVRNSAKASL